MTRRVEEFAALVERGGVDPVTDIAARDGELVELVGALRAVPPAIARPDFVSDLRSALLAEARTGPIPGDRPVAVPRAARERRLAVALAGIAAVVTTVGSAVVSQGALPGETLYPVKRVIEQAEAGLSSSDGDRGGTVLAQAADRLDEVDALTEQDHVDDEVRIAETLESFSDQAATGADLLITDYVQNGTESSVADLRDFVAASLGQLTQLEPSVPSAARTELVDAARTLQRIDAEAELRCPDCGGTPIPTIPPALSAAPAYVVLLAPATVEPAADPDRQGGATGDPGGGVASAGPSDASGPPPPSPSSGTGSSAPAETPTDGGEDAGGGASPSGVAPGDTPSVPVVSELLEEVEDVLGSVVDPLTGP